MNSIKQKQKTQRGEPNEMTSVQITGKEGKMKQIV